MLSGRLLAGYTWCGRGKTKITGTVKKLHHQAIYIAKIIDKGILNCSEKETMFLFRFLG